MLQKLVALNREVNYRRLFPLQCSPSTLYLSDVFCNLLKIAVVGAGPAGSLVALNISDKAEVTVFEAKQLSGFPVKCGGLISEECYNALSKYCRIRKSLLNRIDGAFFFSPDGRFAEVTGKTGGAVIERRILDSMLMEKAGKGASIRIKSKVTGVAGNRLKVTSPEKSYIESFDMVIGADGAESVVARNVGFERPEIYSGRQYLMEFEALSRDMVELYFGRKYSDGFFGYAIPISDDLARVGVVSRDNPSFYLENLIKNHPSVSRRAKKTILEINMGPIPIGLIDFVKGSTVLIGDSAGMVKPYTGGGLYYLLEAAEMFGETFPNPEKFRIQYMRRFSKEYRSGERIRRLYEILNDEDYGVLIDIAKDVDFSKIHMDRPSTAFDLIPQIMRLLRNPPLVTKLLRALF